MPFYNTIAQSTESTVVAEYVPENSRFDAYQSEAALEREFIRLLTTQGYEYLTIHDEKALVANLRRQLETLNGYVFSDNEWEQFFSDCIASLHCQQKRGYCGKDPQNTGRPCAASASGQWLDQKYLSD